MPFFNRTAGLRPVNVLINVMTKDSPFASISRDKMFPGEPPEKSVFAKIQRLPLGVALKKQICSENFLKNFWKIPVLEPLFQ